MWGETYAPPAHAEAPWIDEVQQSVAVILKYNFNEAYPQFSPDCSLDPITGDRNRTTCKGNYVHQAGAYQRDANYTDVPFYSPSLLRHCSRNSCLFASWGTHAHVATPFTSPIMYINKYTNCGAGVIEHVQMIHNFADPNNPDGNPNFARDTDYTYFNVGWGGPRTSVLPTAIEPGANGGSVDSLSYANPATTDSVDVCAWGSPEEIAVIQDLKELGGYTAFVEQGLDIGGLPPIELPCRKPGDDGNCTASPTTCTVSSCTDQQVADDEYVRMELRVAANSSPNCKRHGAPSAYDGNGFIALFCDFHEGNFGNLATSLTGYPCAPGVQLYFVNTRTSAQLPVAFVRHWSWNSSTKRVYFSVYADSEAEAKNTVNDLFDNTGNSTELPIDVEFAIVGKSDPYNPSSLNAFTYVYGKGEDYASSGGSVGGTGRRRLGTSARDYTVFTINLRRWLF